jgi:hypothetical protein
MGNKMNNKVSFNPLFFQASLAAGGISLMPFNFLQFAIPHEKGLIKFSDMAWGSMSGIDVGLYGVLTAIMLVSIVVHLSLTTVFLSGLIKWLKGKGTFSEFISDPYKNVTIFAIVGSLGMTANVLWAPVGFFVPFLSKNLQALMLPSLLYFGLLLISLFYLELKVVKTWRTDTTDLRKFNFVWLLDTFAFGLVSLTGSGIAIMASNDTISSVAVFGTVFTVIAGLFILTVKLTRLINNQIKATKLPDTPILPAFFLVIPITCLYGLSLFRLASYGQTLLSVDFSGLSSIIVNASFAITLIWAMFTIYLIGDYLKNQFLKSSYAAPQWGMV